jgi:hypothetical protein
MINYIVENAQYRRPRITWTVRFASRDYRSSRSDRRQARQSDTKGHEIRHSWVKWLCHFLWQMPLEELLGLSEGLFSSNHEKESASHKSMRNRKERFYEEFAREGKGDGADITKQLTPLEKATLDAQIEFFTEKRDKSSQTVKSCKSRIG